jgi:protein ImuA
MGAGGAAHGVPEPTRIEGLRARVRAIEGGARGGREVATLGAALDTALPWGGLPAAALHEVAGTAAGSFVAALAGRLAAGRGALVWCQTAASERRLGALYGPGLAAFGIDWRRLVLARARDGREALWAMEEALRSEAVTCAVAESDRLDLVMSRRLMLAAEAGRGAGLVLRPGAPDLAPNAALTRWHAEPLAVADLPGGDGQGWRLSLWRCRGGAPGHWKVVWDERALAFLVAPRLADRAGAAAGPALRAAVPA